MLCLLLVTLVVQGFSQPLRVLRLQCEGAGMPLGVESPTPSLGWQLQSGRRNVLQTAYRVWVATDSLTLAKGKGDVWDSKKIFSDASVNVRYAGNRLLPATTYYWKVIVWDNQSSFAQSKIARWQTGLFGKGDWKGAKWIAYEKLADSNVNVLPTDGKKDAYTGSNVLPLFRKPFVVKKSLQSASLFICGLGQFEASINGQKLGDHFLDPGWTKYDRQALYVPFDLSAHLSPGENVLGVMLGNGFYYVPPVSGRYRKLKAAFGYPKMICRLVLRYRDGSTEDVVSDESWTTARSPVTFSSIYGGEDYDARLEQKGWNRKNFDDRGWEPVLPVDGPLVLNAQTAEPLKVVQIFSPKTFRVVNGDTLVYDLGQNFSGIPRITVQGKRGDTVRIYPGELLKPDETVAQRASGGPYYLQYILKGDDVRSAKQRPLTTETWAPRFTYYGFRYLQVVGARSSSRAGPKGLSVLLSVAGLHTRNGAATTGTFHSSNDLFNKTATLIDWAVKSNLASVLTDCPHREKLGWLEQSYLMGNSVHYGYDVRSLFRKMLSDVRYSQLPDGMIPEHAPEYVKFDWGGGIFRDSPEWGSAAVILPWYLYEWYGDKTVLEENYDMMKRYVAYLQTTAKNNILSQGLGDWYDIGPKPPGTSQQTTMGVTGTAIYFYDLVLLTKIASLLGRGGEGGAYHDLSLQVKKAFNDSFYHPDTKRYATGSQTAAAMALYMNLVDSPDRAAVVQNLVKDIEQNSLTAGDIGYRFVLAALHEAGRDDVIFHLNNRSDVPGYGYQLAKGATTLTESWQALPTVSNNHLMLGHLLEWFYSGLGGIGQTQNSVGYKEIEIAPRPVGDVSAASASFECPYGHISTSWTKTGAVFRLDVEVPPNARGVVLLPATDAASVLEGNRPVQSSKDIKTIGLEDGKLKLGVGSGRYRFTVTDKDKKEVTLSK